jgi:hypothetical protein
LSAQRRGAVLNAVSATPAARAGRDLLDRGVLVSPEGQDLDGGFGQLVADELAFALGRAGRRGRDRIGHT